MSASDLILIANPKSGTYQIFPIQKSHLHVRLHKLCNNFKSLLSGNTLLNY